MERAAAFFLDSGFGSATLSAYLLSLPTIDGPKKVNFSVKIDYTIVGIRHLSLKSFKTQNPRIAKRQ